MILVIGTEHCPTCFMTKKTLEGKNIEFSYKNFNELSKEEQETYTSMAKYSGKMNFPIIIKDSQIITLQEV